MRSLRRGASGDAVGRLQKKLHEYGYDAGEQDGVFGYVTEHALRCFQRDFRLKADGIAGPRTMYALNNAPASYPSIHVARPRETLADVARRYDVAVPALRWMNEIASPGRLRPGRRLVVGRTYVAASPSRRERPDTTMRYFHRYARSLSAFVVPGTVGQNGELTFVEDMDRFGATTRDEYGKDFGIVIQGKETPLGSLLVRPRVRRCLLEALVRRCGDDGGMIIVLDIRGVPLGSGAAVQRFCAQLKNTLPRVYIHLSLPVLPTPRQTLLYGFDWVSLSDDVDRVMLDFHHWDFLIERCGMPVDFSVVERWVGAAMKEIPPWKVGLSLPADGCRLDSAGRTVGEAEITYTDVVHRSIEQGRRPEADASGFLRVEAEQGEGKDGSAYVFQGRVSLERFLRLAVRHGISAVHVHGFTSEDRRLWDFLSRSLAIAPSFQSGRQ